MSSAVRRSAFSPKICAKLASRRSRYREACVEFAAEHTWKASARAFIEHMADIRNAQAPDEATDLLTEHPRFVT
jgi:hypothetical protein